MRMHYDFDLGDSKKKKKRELFRRRALSLLIETIVVIGAAFFLVHFAFEKTFMDGESMGPTLPADTKLLVNRASYVFGAPKRFDVVVFHQDAKEHGYYHIKRVIGLPGETVQIVNGSIYINDELLDEPMKELDDMHLSGLATEPLKLEEDEYFVLGDNRNKSEDSRFANIGNITEKQIIGKAWLSLSPFNFVSKMNIEKQD